MQPLLWKEVLDAVSNGQEPSPAQWDALSPDEKELIELLQKEKLTANAVAFLDGIDEDKAWLKLHGKIPRRPPVRMRVLRYAAACILLLGAATLFFLQRHHSARPVIAGKYITDPINPKRATLVLGDGQQVELSVHPGYKAQQGQVEVVNIDTTLLRYTAAGNAAKAAEFNTLIVPRGAHYKIELADGSEIWLNAASKLRYPAHFGGVTERKVFLESGEAYFKIGRNAALPFVVKANGVDITVLGTEFNVNTYTQDYATTLVNGSVKLNAGTAATLLQPDEQAIWANGAFRKRAVDVNTYTAWKDGQIIFEEALLEDVMNILGRQYDFTVEFSSPELKKRKFGGSLRQTQHIEDVLTIIEKTGSIKFSIRGKTILVEPAIPR